MDQQMIAGIVEEIVRQLLATGNVALPDVPASPSDPAPVPHREEEWEDITAPACRATPLVDHPEDPEALVRMMKRTTARIGVGRAGPRLKTRTLLTLRADHAQARDAVFAAVDKALTRHLNQLSKEKDLAAQRYQKFRAMGVVREENEI